MGWINIVLLIYLAHECYGQCNWPVNLQNSVWVDSDKETLTFATTSMSGYTISSLSSWDCLYRIDYTATLGYTTLIMQSSSTVRLFKNDYRPFLCLRLTAVSDYSYYYYIMAEEELRLDNERVKMMQESAISSITTSNAESLLCVTSSSGPTVNEYHFMVKDSRETDAKQTCPTDLQDEFSYAVNDGGSVTCGQNAEHWNVCNDVTQMTFNYTLCTTAIAYSSTATVTCMASITSGSYVFTTVRNADPNVNPPTSYRFSCFMSEKYSNGSIALSQSPKSCTKDQTPTTQPEHVDGTKGVVMSLVPFVQYPTTTTTTTTTTTSTTTTTTPTTTSTTTTTPTTTTTTPTTTTTTPTTTTTTPTTTTSTTTTTTTPTTTSTTTTTPTTTTTTPTTTTTTTPTTTTTSTTTTTPTTTTTTTPTTTTTTPTTTSTTTTTAAPQVATTSADNMIAIIAAAVGGLAALLTVLLIIGLVVYCCCLRKERPVTPKEPTPPPSPEPDLTIESTEHSISGNANLTPRSLLGPRGTSLISDTRPQSSLYVFPGAKNNNFTLHMPSLKDTIGSSPVLPNKTMIHNYHQPHMNGKVTPSLIKTNPRVSRTKSMMSPRRSPIIEERSFTETPPPMSYFTQNPENESQDLSRAKSPPLRHSISSPTLPVGGSPEEPQGKISVPATVKPFIITPQKEREINSKSRANFSAMSGENTINEDDRADESKVENAKSEILDVDCYTGANEQEEEYKGKKLFETQNLNGANMSKPANDIILMNTPSSVTITSRHTSAGSITNRSLFTNHTDRTDVTLPPLANGDTPTSMTFNSEMNGMRVTSPVGVDGISNDASKIVMLSGTVAGSSACQDLELL